MSKVRPLIGKETAVAYLRTLVPDVDELLRQMEKDGGWLRLSPKAVAWIAQFKITNYAENYVEEKRLWALFVMSVVGDIADVPGFLKEVEQEGLENAEDFIRQSMEMIRETDARIERLWQMSDTEREKQRRQFEALPEDERKKQTLQVQCGASFLILLFFQMLALMVHGRKMTDLVSDAMAGDDEAFGKAVQIDRSVLVAIPYFAERLKRAHLQGDGTFCGKLGYRIGNPVLHGKIQYRALFIVFAFLELFGLLDGALKHREILEICDELGIKGRKSRIEDVGYLSKRLAEYRRFQRKGGVATH